MKAEVDKVDINKLVHVPTCLNNLKLKADDLDVSKLKIAHVDLKELSKAVDNDVVKNTKLSILRTKVKKLDEKLPMQLL